MQIEPNVHKIQEHRRKNERMRKEKELRERVQERQRAQVCFEDNHVSSNSIGE